jgi:hypothetical protein
MNSRCNQRLTSSARTRALLGAAAVLSAASTVSAADTTSSWLAAGSGTWSNAANWSAGVPNNGTQTYAAVIGATGAAYTVTLNSAITVNDFTLNAADATLNHTGGVFSVLASPINLSSGAYRLSGGTISGGSINFGGGTLVFTSSGGVLSGTSIVGDVSFSEASARARFQSGADFTGNATLSGTNSILSYEYSAALGAGRTINLESTGADLNVAGNNTLTVAPGATVRGRGQVRSDLFVSGTGILVNNGVISADVAANLLSISTDAFTNNGTLQLVNGASLTVNAGNWVSNGTILLNGSTGTFASNWTNAGSVNLNNATLNLAGSFTTAAMGLANLSRAGATTINLVGNLDNSAATLNLNAATGSIRFMGGTISGGTIARAGGADLVFTGTGGVLSGTSIVGDVGFTEAGARARFQSGADFTGNATLSGTSSILSYEYDATLGAGRTINIESTSADLNVAGNHTLTIASGATVRGRGQVRSDQFVSGNGIVINNGLVSADVPSNLLTISPDSFTNNATARSVNAATLTISAANFTNNAAVSANASAVNVTSTNWTNVAGGSVSVSNSGTATFGGNWTNLGVVNVNNSILNLDGTFSTASILPPRLVRSGGTVNLTGFLDNTAATLALDASTGSFRLVGGTISGGTVTRAGGAELVFTGSSGVLSGTSIVGDVNFSETSARARFQSGADFTGNATLSSSGSILSYEYDATLGGTRTINLDNVNADFNVAGTNTLTIGAGATLRGRGQIRSDLFVSGNSTVINNGTIRADLSGGTLTVSPDALVNGIGTLRASGGGKLVVSTLTGNLNSSSADGTSSLIRLAAGTYTINQPLAVTGHATVHLKGNWTKAANIDASGRIIFDYDLTSPLTSIRGDIISGYNGGMWSGSGINSSAAAAGTAFGVGYAEASDILGATGGQFSGESVDGTAVLVRYTRYGDANLDGSVNLPRA